jgi:hypothetical protein
MKSYIDTCPQRAITEVHHTIATWLPVALECGHTTKINWTAHVGQTTGCTECAREQTRKCRQCGDTIELGEVCACFDDFVQCDFEGANAECAREQTRECRQCGDTIELGEVCACFDDFVQCTLDGKVL